MTGFIVLNASLVALVGATLAATPHLMPPTECFAVTVPPSAKQDPRVRALFRTYTIAVAAITAAAAIATALVMPHADDTTAALAITGAVLIPMACSFALMLWARSRVRMLKQAEGWTAAESHAAAFVSDDSIPTPVPLAWELLHVVIVFALAAFALAAYDRLPDQIPMHAGFDGAVDSYADKSLGVVLFPVFIAAFMGAVLAFVHVAMVRSKKPIDPAAPATSAYAYGMFVRAQSIVLLVGGLILNAAMGASFLLSSSGAITIGAAGTITTVVTVAFTAAMVGLAVRYGQSGGRMAAELRTGDDIARDDDRFYKLGLFYVNPSDPSIWVPKRFGVGWTLNYGRQAAWAITALLALLIVGFVAVSLMMAG